MDAETWERKSDVPQGGRAGEKLCGACIQRIEERERAEAEERERKMWETH